MAWLIVEKPGSFIGKKGGRVVVYNKEEPPLSISIHKLDAVILKTNAGISSSLIKQLLEHNIPLIIENLGKDMYFYQSSSLSLPKLRYGQIMMNDKKKRYFTYQILKTKVFYQYKVLNFFEWECEKPDKSHYENILNLESQYARHYWSVIRKNIPFAKNRGRHATDPFNQALNYAYGILKHRVLYAVLRAGLDPYFGVIHQIRDYRISFVFDIMELFRPVCDLTVIKFFLKHGEVEFEDVKYGLVQEVLDSFEHQMGWWKKRQEKISRCFDLQCLECASFIADKQKYMYVYGWDP